MMEQLRERFFSPEQAFADPLTCWAVGIIGVLFVLSLAITFALKQAGRLSDELHTEIMVRWRSWVFICAAVLLPILFGSGWVMLGVCILSLLCYREFARATGMGEENTINVVVLLGILLVTFAVADNYSRLFFASAALTVGLLAICTIPQDRPKGYLQRTSLGALGFILFGFSFGYLGYFANSPKFRSILLLLILCVELNDIFAFCCGKLIGGPKAIPNTSPGKTWSGCIGALVITTGVTMTLAHFVFAGTELDRWDRLLIFGAGLSILGQFGDLLLSSIKRDVGVKDMGDLIPAHGGLLDRFDSLVLVPPAAFHYISLFVGEIGADRPQRIFTGG